MICIKLNHRAAPPWRIKPSRALPLILYKYTSVCPCPPRIPDSTVNRRVYYQVLTSSSGVRLSVGRIRP
jgi:hypothetical protein